MEVALGRRDLLKTELISKLELVVQVIVQV